MISHVPRGWSTGSVAARSVLVTMPWPRSMQWNHGFSRSTPARISSRVIFTISRETYDYRQVPVTGREPNMECDSNLDLDSFVLSIQETKVLSKLSAHVARISSRVIFTISRETYDYRQVPVTGREPNMECDSNLDLDSFVLSIQETKV